MAVMTPDVHRLPPEAIQFLADLAANNERAWFQPRKADYERLLKEPLEALSSPWRSGFEARGIPLRADPAKSPFRIYRDTRFSKDKSPYKTNVGASFPWVGDDADEAAGRSHTSSVHASGGYFHLQPGEIYVGGGIWHPESSGSTPGGAGSRRSGRGSARSSTIRRSSRRSATSSGDGHSLKRVPAGFPADHPAADLLKLEGRHLRPAAVGRRGDVAAAARCDRGLFAAGHPMMRFLASIG